MLILITQSFFPDGRACPKAVSYRWRKKGFVIFSKPDHKTADSLNGPVTFSDFKDNFKRSVFSYLVVYGLDHTLTQSMALRYGPFRIERKICITIHETKIFKANGKTNRFFF